MKRFQIAFFLFFAALVSAQAARVLENFEIGQLCAMASLVVRAEVEDATDVSTRDGDCAVGDVKILSTLKGNSSPGTIIRVAGVEQYHKGPGIPGVASGFPRLAKGDTVFLLLVPKGTPIAYSMYDLTDADWKIIESGARLVAGDIVYDFGQYYPPARTICGPLPGFVAMTEKTFPDAQVLSVRTFEQQVEESVAKH